LNKTTNNPLSNKIKVKPSQRKSNLDVLKNYGINAKMSKGYLYILECANGAYYTGSTKYLNLRLQQHQNGEGANFTKKHLPVKLVYYEEFQRIDEAFYREKQIQGWSRKKKEALMSGFVNKLHELAECKNETHFRNVVSTSLNNTLDSESPARFGSNPTAPFGSDSTAPFGSDSTAPFGSAQGAVEPGGSLSEAVGLLSGAETTHSLNICQPCGLCCDGTLIGFVQLEREEVPVMRPLLKVEEANGNGVFLQPCINYCGGCGIYEKRPKQCAAYECQLLKSVEQNELEFDKAVEMIIEVKELKSVVEKQIAELQLELQAPSFYFKMEEIKNLLQNEQSELTLTAGHLKLRDDLERLDVMLVKYFGE
jgi:uncharacterized protein